MNSNIFIILKHLLLRYLKMSNDCLFYYVKLLFKRELNKLSNVWGNAFLNMHYNKSVYGTCSPFPAIFN